MISILFVCHGNICRSPMAEFVMQKLVNEAGLSDQFRIASAATSREEIGNDVHYETKQKMAEMGVPIWRREARQMTKQDYLSYEYVILMDDNNWRNTMRIIGKDRDNKVYKAMYFTTPDVSLQADEGQRRAPRDVKDPWYTGNFDETYDDVIVSCTNLLAAIRHKHGI